MWKKVVAFPFSFGESRTGPTSVPKSSWRGGLLLTHLQGRAAPPSAPPTPESGPRSGVPGTVSPRATRTPPGASPRARNWTSRRGLHSHQTPVGPPRGRGASSPYLSSETLMTPSSLGTITAMFTTSCDPSTRCRRIGLRVRGWGWISAAIGGGAPGERPTAPGDWAEETVQARAQDRAEMQSGPSEAGDHSPDACPGNVHAPASGTNTGATPASSRRHLREQGAGSRGGAGAGPVSRAVAPLPEDGH